MSRFVGVDKNIHDQQLKTGVLLVNLGTPDAPTAPALRRYLSEFLSDPRVVEIPRLVWMIILHGIILRVRPAKSAALYQSIWTEDGSPLLAITKRQLAKLKESLKGEYGDNVVVDIAMRYGNPSMSKALKSFQQQGVNNIVVLPLYPQYAGPTTASAFDAVVKELQQWRWIPSLHFIGTYHDHPLYIASLAASVREHIQAHGKPDKLVLSYHGMPKLFHDNGDPYYCFCAKTTRLLAEELQLSEDDFVMTFQSRFGKAEWLKPYTDETLEQIATQGIKNIAIISPAFSADCLETLEELESENREVFVKAGGEQYHYIPALNDRDDHIKLMLALINKHI
ncbi:ferrochelatase [Thalassotalea sp. M1531]|uniref:Ferrochelatase n=1 Tax=Thalassotalea algicola TaxID=2716224 RepID=A0A7Y0Q6R8_9GAMM|nr:ferrochelatase [Thalassotalea algicola]NMP30260.1 ferrochelatase [Thalassotalea algicola]